MRGSFTVLAALCLVVAAAEASSVRFVSIDEGKSNDGKEKNDENGVSEGSNSDVRKNIDEAVKKINDEVIPSEKTLKMESGSGAVEEAVKKSDVPEKAKIQKREVMRAIDLLARKALKRAEGEVSPFPNLKNRKLVLKYLKIQRDVVDKIVNGITYIIDRIETNEKEKEFLLDIMKKFKVDLDQTYEKAIKAIENTATTQPYVDPVSLRNKLARSVEVPNMMTIMNQRNPLAMIPSLINIISGAVSVASGRSSDIDIAAICPMLEKALDNLILTASAGITE